MVVFDSSILLLILNPDAKAPVDPATGKTVEKAAERIEYLIKNLTARKEKVIIPTPALSEVLVHADDARDPYLDKLENNAVFRIAPFDQKAAIEAALNIKDAIQRGGHRVDAANPDATKTKIKFDRQIMAIAKVEKAHTVYSDDEDLHKYADRAGLEACRTADLDLPPRYPQGTLGL